MGIVLRCKGFSELPQRLMLSLYVVCLHQWFGKEEEVGSMLVNIAGNTDGGTVGNGAWREILSWA